MLILVLVLNIVIVIVKVRLGGVRLDVIGSLSTRLDWMGLDWIGLDRMGSDWIGLDLNGLECNKFVCLFVCWWSLRVRDSWPFLCPHAP